MGDTLIPLSRDKDEKGRLIILAVGTIPSQNSATSTIQRTLVSDLGVSGKLAPDKRHAALYWKFGTSASPIVRRNRTHGVRSPHSLPITPA